MKKTLLISLSLTGLLLTRFYFYFNVPKPYKNGDKIRITSIVRSEPIRYEKSQYLKLQGLKIYLPLYPEVYYGDKVVVEGLVEGNTLKKVRLVELKESTGLLYRFRKSLLSFYQSSLPQPHSSLVAGVTIGSKSDIPEHFWDGLKKTGTAHVVVASGMNVALIGGFLISFFTLFLKRKKALFLTFVGIWLYTVLSGFDAPIVRAGVMGTLAFSAQEFGKVYFALRILIVSVVLMLFAAPGYLLDVGFLLSFFATLSLILFQKKVEEFLKFVPALFRENLSTALAAQLGVAPILYLSFGQFNLLSPVINVLVLWTVVPLTILGMLAGMVGLFVPFLGSLLLLLSYPLSLWFINVVEFFS